MTQECGQRFNKIFSNGQVQGVYAITLQTLVDCFPAFGFSCRKEASDIGAGCVNQHPFAAFCVLHFNQPDIEQLCFCRICQ